MNRFCKRVDDFNPPERSWRIELQYPDKGWWATWGKVDLQPGIPVDPQNDAPPPRTSLKKHTRYLSDQNEHAKTPGEQRWSAPSSRSCLVAVIKPGPTGNVTVYLQQPFGVRSMTANDFRRMVTQRPFVPFVVTTSLGETYLVSHPDLVMVGLGSVTIGVPSDEDPAIYSDAHIVSLRHVVRLQPAGEQPNPQTDGETQ